MHLSELWTLYVRPKEPHSHTYSHARVHVIIITTAASLCCREYLSPSVQVRWGRETFFIFGLTTGTRLNMHLSTLLLLLANLIFFIVFVPFGLVSGLFIKRYAAEVGCTRMGWSLAEWMVGVASGH